VPDLDLPALAARQGHQNPQRLIPIGATRAAELSLLKILLVPIRKVERALTEGKFLFSSIKEQLGDSIIEDAEQVSRQAQGQSEVPKGQAHPHQVCHW
jgi:hypothetical protein